MIKEEKSITVDNLNKDETIVLENREVIHLKAIDKKCKRCGKSWAARVENPKQCPFCKRYDWNEDKINNKKKGK